MINILDSLTPSLVDDNYIIQLLLYERKVPTGCPGSENTRKLIENIKEKNILDLTMAKDGADSIKAMKIAKDEWRIFYNVEDIDILLN